MDMLVYIFVLACLTCLINGTYIPLRLSPSPSPSFTPSPFRQISQLYKGPFQGALPPIPLNIPRPGIPMYSFPVLPLQSPWTSPPPMFTPIVPVSQPQHRSPGTRNRALPVGPVRTTAKGGFDYPRGSFFVASNTRSSRPANYDRVQVQGATSLLSTPKFSFDTQIRIPSRHVKGSLDMPVGFIINPVDVGVNSPRVALVDGIPVNLQVEGVASSHDNTQGTRPPDVMNSGPSYQYQDIRGNTQTDIGSQRRTTANAREPGSLTLGLQMDNLRGTSYQKQQMANHGSEQGLLIQSNVQSQRATSLTQPVQTSSKPQYNSENYGRSGTKVFLQGSTQHSINQPKVMQGVVHSMASQVGQTHNEPNLISTEPNLFESTQNVVFDSTPKKVSGSVYDQHTYQPTQKIYSRQGPGTDHQYLSGIVDSMNVMKPVTTPNRDAQPVAAANTEAQATSSYQVNVLQDVNINGRVDAQPVGAVVGKNIIKTSSKDMQDINTLGTSKDVPSVQGTTSSGMKNTMQDRTTSGNQVDASASRYQNMGPGVESNVLKLGPARMIHTSTQLDHQHLGHQPISNQAAATGDVSTYGGQQSISNQAASNSGKYTTRGLSTSGGQQPISNQAASNSGQYATGDLSTSGGQQSISNQVASNSGQYTTVDLSTSGGQQSASNQVASNTGQYTTGDLSTSVGQQSISNQAASNSGQYGAVDLSTSGGHQSASNQVASNTGQYTTGDLSTSGGQQSISNQAASNSGQYATRGLSASVGQQSISNQVASNSGQSGAVDLSTSEGYQPASNQAATTSGQYTTRGLSASSGQQSISNQAASINGQYGPVDFPAPAGHQPTPNQGPASTSGQYATGDLSTSGGQQSISNQAASTSGQYTTGDRFTYEGQQSASNQVASNSGPSGAVDLSTSVGQQSISNQAASTSGQYTAGNLLTYGGQLSVSNQVASTSRQYGAVDLSTSEGHQPASNQPATTSGQYTTRSLSASGGQQSISNQAASNSGQYATGDLSTFGGQQSISNQVASTSGQYGAVDLSKSGGQQSISNQAASNSGQYGAVDLSTSGGQQSISNQAASTSGQYTTKGLPTSGGQQSISNQAASASGQYTSGDWFTSEGQQSASNQVASNSGQSGAVDLSTSGGQQSISNQVASTSGQYGAVDLSTSVGQQSISNQAASINGQYGPVDFPAPAGHQPTSNQGPTSTSGQYRTVALSTSVGQQSISNQAASNSGQYGAVDLSKSGGQQSISNQAASTSGQYTTKGLPTSGGQQSISNQVASASGQYTTGDWFTSEGQQSASHQVASNSGQSGAVDLSTSGGQQSISNQVASTSGQYGAVDLSTSVGQQSISNQAASINGQYGPGDFPAPAGHQPTSNQGPTSTSGQYRTVDLSTSVGQQSISNQAASNSGQYGAVDLSKSGGQQSISNQVASTSGQYGAVDLSASVGQQSISNQAASNSGQYGAVDLSTSGGQQSISNQVASTSGQYTTGDWFTSGGQQSASNQVASTSGQYTTGDWFTSEGQQSASHQVASTSGQYGAVDLSTSGGQQSISNQVASTSGQYGAVDLSTSGGQQSISNQVASTSGQYGAVDLSTSGGQQAISNQVASTSGQYGAVDLSTSGGQQSISNQAASINDQYGPVDFPAPAGHQPSPNQGPTSTSGQYGTVDLSTSAGQQLAPGEAATTSEQYRIVDLHKSGGQQSTSDHVATTSGQHGTVDLSASAGQQLTPSQIGTSASGGYRTVDVPTSHGQQLTRDETLHQGVTSTNTQYGAKDMATSHGTQGLHDLTQTTTNNGISTYRPVQQDTVNSINKIKEEIAKKSVGHTLEAGSMIVGIPQFINDQTNLNQYSGVSPGAAGAADQLGTVVERQSSKKVDLQGLMPIVAGVFGMSGATGDTQEAFHNNVLSGLTGQGHDSFNGPLGVQEIRIQQGASDIVSNQGMVSPVGQSIIQDMSSNDNLYGNLDLSGGQGLSATSDQYADIESTRPNTATVATGESTYTIPPVFPAQDSGLAINNNLEKEAISGQGSVGTRSILHEGSEGTSLEKEFMSLLLHSRSQDSQSANTHYDPLAGQGNVNATQVPQRNHALKTTNTFNATKQSSKMRIIENTRSGFSINKTNANTVSTPSNRPNPHLPVLNEVDTHPLLPSSTRARGASVQTTFEIIPVTKTATGTNHKPSSISSAQKTDTVGNGPIDIRIAPTPGTKPKDTFRKGMSNRITEDKNASATERARMAVRSDKSLSFQKTSPIQSRTRTPLKSFNVFQPLEYGAGRQQESNQMYDSSLPSVISETTVPAFATGHQEFISFPEGKSSKLTHILTPSPLSTTHTTGRNTNSTFPQAVSSSKSFINTLTSNISNTIMSEIQNLQNDTATHTTSPVSLPEIHSTSNQSALNSNTKALAATLQSQSVSQANAIDIHLPLYHDTLEPTPHDVPEVTKTSAFYSSQDSVTRGSVLYSDLSSVSQRTLRTQGEIHSRFDGKQSVSAGSTVIRGVDTSSNFFSQSINNIHLHPAARESSKISLESNSISAKEIPTRTIPTPKCATVICIDKHISSKKIKEYLTKNPSPKAIGSLQLEAPPSSSTNANINAVSHKAAGNSISSSQEALHTDLQVLPLVIPLAQSDGIGQSSSSHSVVHGVGAKQSSKSSRSQDTFKELPTGITPASVDRAVRGHAWLDITPRTHGIPASPDNLEPYTQTHTGRTQKTNTSPTSSDSKGSTSQTLKCVTQTCIDKNISATKLKAYMTSNASPKVIGNRKVDASTPSGTKPSTAAMTNDVATSNVNALTSSLKSVTHNTKNMHLIDMLTSNTDSSETNPLLNTGRNIQTVKHFNTGSYNDLAHPPHVITNTGTDNAHSSDISTQSVSTQLNTRFFNTPVPHTNLTTQSESTHSNTSHSDNPAHSPYLTPQTESTHSNTSHSDNPTHSPYLTPQTESTHSNTSHSDNPAHSPYLTPQTESTHSNTSHSDNPAHSPYLTPQTESTHSNTSHSDNPTHSPYLTTQTESTHSNTSHSDNPTHSPYLTPQTESTHSNTSHSDNPAHSPYLTTQTESTHSNTSHSDNPAHSPYLTPQTESTHSNTSHSDNPAHSPYLTPQTESTHSNTSHSDNPTHSPYLTTQTESTHSNTSHSDNPAHSPYLTPQTESTHSNTSHSDNPTHSPYLTTQTESTHSNTSHSDNPTHSPYLTPQTESTHSNTSHSDNPAHSPYLTPQTESTHSNTSHSDNPTHSPYLTTQAESTHSNTSHSDNPAHSPYLTTQTESVSTHSKSGSPIDPIHPTNTAANIETDNIYSNIRSSILTTFPGISANSKTGSSDIPSRSTYAPTITSTASKQSNTVFFSNIQTQPKYSPTSLDRGSTQSNTESPIHPTHPTYPPTNPATDTIYSNTDSYILLSHLAHTPTHSETATTHSNTLSYNIQTQPMYSPTNTEPDRILSNKGFSILPTHSSSVPPNPATDSMHPNAEPPAPTKPQTDGSHSNTGSSNINTHPTHVQTNTETDSMLSKSESSILLTHPATDSIYSKTGSSILLTHPPYITANPPRSSTHLNSEASNFPTHPTYPPTDIGNNDILSTSGFYILPTQPASGPTNPAPDSTNSNTLSSSVKTHPTFASTHAGTASTNSKTSSLDISSYPTYAAINSPEDTTGNTSNHVLLEHHSNQTKQNSDQTLEASKCVTEICIDKTINQGKLYAYLTSNASPKAIGNMQLDALPSLPTNNKTDSITNEISTSNESEFTSSLRPVSYNTKIVQPMESSSTSGPPNIHTTHLTAHTGSASSHSNPGSANIPNHPTQPPTNTDFNRTHSSPDSSPTSSHLTYATNIGTTSTNSKKDSSSIPSHPTYATINSATAGMHTHFGASDIPTHSTEATKNIGIDGTHSKTDSSKISSHPTFAPTNIETAISDPNTVSSIMPTNPAYETLETSTSGLRRFTEHIPTTPVFKSMNSKPASTHQDSSHSWTHESDKPLNTQLSGRHTSTVTLQRFAHTSALPKFGPDTTHPTTENHITNDKFKANLTNNESQNRTQGVPVAPDSSSHKTFLNQTQTKQNTNQTLKAPKCVTEICIDKTIKQGKLYAYLTSNASPKAIGNMQLDAPSSLSTNNNIFSITNQISTSNVSDFSSSPKPVQTNTNTLDTLESLSSKAGSPNIPTRPTYLTAITGSASAHSSSANSPKHPTHPLANTDFRRTHYSADSSTSSSHVTFATNIGTASTNSKTGSSDTPLHPTYATTNSAALGVQTNTRASEISTHSNVTSLNPTHEIPVSTDVSRNNTFHNQTQSGLVLDAGYSQSPVDTTGNTSNHVLLEHHSKQTKQKSNQTLKTSKCVTEICIDKTINQGKLYAYLTSNASPKAIGNMQLDALPSLPTNNKTDSITNEISTSNVNEFFSSLSPVGSNTKTLHTINSSSSKSGTPNIHTTHLTTNTSSASADLVASSANSPHNPSYLTNADVDRKHLNRDSPNFSTYPPTNSGPDNTQSNTVSTKNVTRTDPSINTGTDSTLSNMDSSTSSIHSSQSASNHVIETLGTTDTSTHSSGRSSSVSTHTLYQSANTGSSIIPTYHSATFGNIAASIDSNTVFSTSQTHPTYPPTNSRTATTRSSTILFDIPSHAFDTYTESTSAHANTVSSNILISSTNPPTNTEVANSNKRSSNIPTHLTFPSRHIGTSVINLYTVSHIQSHSTNPPTNTENGIEQSKTYTADPSIKVVRTSTYSNTGSSNVPKHPTFPPIDNNTAGGHFGPVSTNILTHSTDPLKTRETASTHLSTGPTNITTNPADPSTNAGTTVSSITSPNIPSHPIHPSTNTGYKDLNTGTNVPTHSPYPSSNTATSSTRSSNIPTNSPSVPRNTGTAGIPSNSGSSTILQHSTHALGNIGDTRTHPHISFANILANSTYTSTNTGTTGTHGNSGSQTTFKSQNTVSANSHSTTKSSRFLAHHTYTATNIQRVSNKPGYPTPNAETPSPSLPKIVNAQTRNIPIIPERLTFESTDAHSLSAQHSAIRSSITQTTGKQDETLTSAKEPLSHLEGTSNTSNRILPGFASSFYSTIAGQKEPSSTPVPLNVKSVDGDGGTLRGVTHEKTLTRSDQLPNTKCSQVTCIDKHISDVKAQAYLDSNASPKAIGLLQPTGTATSYGETHPHINTVFIQTVASEGNTVQQTSRLDQTNTVSEGKDATTTMQDINNHRNVQSAKQSYHTQPMNKSNTAVNQLGAERHASVPTPSVTSANSLSTHNTSPSAVVHLDGQPLPTSSTSETVSKSVLSSNGSAVTPSESITHTYSQSTSNSSRVNQGKNNISTQIFSKIPPSSSRCHTPNCIEKQKINATLKTNMTNKDTTTGTGKIHSKPETLFHTKHHSAQMFQEQSSQKGNTFSPTESYKYTPKPVEGKSDPLSENSINHPVAPHNKADSINILQHSANKEASSLEPKPHRHHVNTVYKPLSTNGDAIVQDNKIQHHVQRYGAPKVEIEISTTGASRGEASQGEKQSKPQTKPQSSFQQDNKGFGSGSKCNKTETCINMHISHSLLSAYLARKVAPTPIGQMSPETIASRTESEGFSDTQRAPHMYILSTRDSGYNSVNPVPQEPSETSKELNESEIEVKAILSNNRRTRASGLFPKDPFKTYAKEFGNPRRISANGVSSKNGVGHNAEVGTPDLHRAAVSTEMGAHSENGISSSKHQGFTGHNTLHEMQPLSGIIKGMGGSQEQNRRLNGGGEKSKQGRAQTGTDRQFSTSTDASSPASPPSHLTIIPPTPTRGGNSLTLPGLFDYTAVNGQGGGYSGTTDYGPITNDVMQFLSTQGFNNLDAYLHNELSQTLDSPVPYTSPSSSASSQGSTSGTGTTTVNVMKTLTQSQSNQLPPDTVASSRSEPYGQSLSAVTIDVQNPPAAKSRLSSQENAQAYGASLGAVNDIIMPNMATEPLHSSNNVVFDVAMGVQGQYKQQHSLKNQEGTLRAGRSTKAVISESIADPLFKSVQITASHLSPDEAGFISMSGTGHTKSQLSLQGHSHQRQTMTLPGIQMLLQGTSDHQAGSQTDQGDATKTSGLQMNVNTGGSSYRTSHQSSSAGTTTTSFNSQHGVGGAQWDLNQPSSGTAKSLTHITSPTDAYTSQQLMDMHIGDTLLGRPLTSTEVDPRNVKSSSLLTSVANEIPSFTTLSGLHSAFSEVQSSNRASEVVEAATTSEGSNTGESGLNGGLDSASLSGQPDSTAAHQKITEEPEFYEPVPRYVDSDQGDSGDGQEMSQNMVNIEPMKWVFGISKDRQMSRHDGQQFLSNSEHSSGYAEYFPSTLLSSR